MLREETLKPDTTATAAFLREITRGWEYLGEPVVLELRCLFPERTPGIARFGYTEAGIADLIAHAQGMNAAGLNCYVCPNPVRAGAPLRRDGKMSGAMDEDIPAAFYFWADGDDEAAATAIRNFVGPKYTALVMTGTQPTPRPHIYWRIADAPMRDLATWSTIQRGIARTLSTDRTVINPARIMRLPGTVNWPTPAKAAKGRVAELATFLIGDPVTRPPVPIEQMRQAFGTVEAPGLQIDTGTYPAPLDRERARIAALSGQEWHSAVIRLVASYVAKGLADDEIHTLTDPLTLSGFTIEQTRREVQTAIDGARRKGWTPEPAYPDPSAINAPPAIATAPAPDHPVPAVRLEWFDEVEPALADNYIIKGLLSSGAMSVLYGPSNSGKTFFALDLAYHIAIGATWRGMRVRQAAVLYLAAEGGRGVANRIAALRAVHGVLDVPFALRRAGMDLLHQLADLQAVVDLAAEVQARFPELPLVIYIDTLSRVMAGGDENSAADMTHLIRNIDQIRALTGAHIVLVHHTGKDAARGARGHSSLRAATDTEIELQNEDGNRAAIVTKQRDYQGGETFAFTLKSISLGHDQDGDEVTSCVVEATDAGEFQTAKTQKRGIGGNQKIIADTFDQMIGDGLGTPNPGGVGFPEPGTFLTVKLADLRHHAQGKMDVKNTRGAFREAWRALVEDRKLFCSAAETCWRVDRPIKRGSR